MQSLQTGKQEDAAHSQLEITLKLSQASNKKEYKFDQWIGNNIKIEQKKNALLISDPCCLKYPMNGIGSLYEEPHVLEERQLM